MEKIKGIESKTNKKGKTTYRLATSVNGQMVRGHWTDSLEDATKELDKYLSFRVKLPTRNQYTKNAKDIRLEQFIQEYSEYAKTQYSINYAIRTSRSVKSLLKDYLPQPISEIAKFDLAPHLQGLKKSTAKVVIAHLGSLNKFADEKGYPFKVNVRQLLSKTKNLPASKEKISFLDRNEVSKLFSFMNGKEEYKTLKQMIILSLYNGLRIGEILALRYRHIDMDKKIIHVSSTKNVDGTFKEGTKNGETRIVPMAKHVREVFDAILTENPEIDFDDLLFPVSYSRVQSKINLLRKNKVLHPDYTFHTFRHSFASIFFKVKWTSYDSMLRLQQLMGHSDLKMSLHYVHLYRVFNDNLLEDLSFNGAEKVALQKQEEEKQSYLGVNISFKTVENKLHLEAPYNGDIIAKYHKLDGKWNADGKVWIFGMDKENEVRELVKKTFGYEEKQNLDSQIADIKAMLESLMTQKG